MLSADKPRDTDFRLRIDLLLKKGPEGLYSEDETPYTAADKLPAFGGKPSAAFREWVYGRVDSLLGAAVAAPRARIIAVFVVERDGTLTDISIRATKDRAAFAKLVRRAVDDSPLWTPAALGGRKVRFRVTETLLFGAARKAETPGSENP